jgi:hypothetical protein
VSDDIIDQLSYYVANEMRMPAGLTITVINHIEAQQAEIERLRQTLVVIADAVTSENGELPGGRAYAIGRIRIALQEEQQ